MKITYNTFLRLFLVVLVAMAVLLSQVSGIGQVAFSNALTAVLVESICILRLRQLGYSVFESLKLLLFTGVKWQVFADKVSSKRS